MSIVGSRALVYATAFALMLAPTASFGELAKWDQKRVSDLAEELSQSAGGLYKAIYRAQVTSNVGSGQSSDYYRLRDRVRVARNEARHLSDRLHDGADRDETTPIYERLMTLVRDAREISRRMFLEEPVMDKMAASSDLLRRIQPYYDPKALENPEAK